ncbi:Hypothetical protein PBC10988_23750 [Planctomycetales bacterium 10988]|nr:Hypothetical protein PBC10988_23750 [Planctomycetales bacterium 10988]
MTNEPQSADSETQLELSAERETSETLEPEQASSEERSATEAEESNSEETPKSNLPEVPRKPAYYIFSLAPLVLGPLWVYGMETIFPGHLLSTLAGFVLLAIICTATYTDSTRMKIYNWIVFPGLFWALGINLAGTLLLSGEKLGSWVEPEQIGKPFTSWPESLGAIGIGWSLLGMLTCFGVMLALAIVAKTRLGDVKIAMAIGAILGVERGLSMLLWTHVAAGVMVFAFAIWRVGPAYLLKAIFHRFGSRVAPVYIAPADQEQTAFLKTYFPMAAAFMIGCLLTIFHGNIVQGELPWN